LAFKHNVQEDQARKTPQRAHLGTGAANMNQSVKNVQVAKYTYLNFQPLDFKTKPTIAFLLPSITITERPSK